MSNIEWLSDLMVSPSVSTTNKLLMILLATAIDEGGLTPSQIRDIARKHGTPNADNLGIHGFLNAANKQGRVKQIEGRWSLTRKGREDLEAEGLRVPIVEEGVVAQKVNELRRFLDRISAPHTRKFVDEAIRCVEVKAYRSAMVTMWSGAVAILHEHVLASHLIAFNIAAVALKHSRVDNEDDLQNFGDQKFLNVAEKANIITKDVKKNLDQSRQWRNSSAHPSRFEMEDHVVAAQIEILILNVFAKYC